MQTNCVVYGNNDGRTSILGMVVGEAHLIRGAVQQYQKAVGPLANRASFNDFVQQNKAIMQIASCVPIDVTQI